ncbi:hypothetical protein B0A48_03931 [Cryoendolithus antarcticus]|uniref:FAD-binding FR-type domain-containing protein n=1 Tax=Cryoendolithus antarcticus TaxID=1507870 RepID=A0A1V8TGW7_9PEZI|nr:hypothetical protein B0A48_03931 [Cryoendolithus antarcticus]
MSLRARIFALEPDHEYGVTDEVGDKRHEVLQRLSAGISFTSWFILTYQIAVLGVLLVFTAWHYYDILSRTRRVQHLRHSTSKADGASGTASETDHDQLTSVHRHENARQQKEHVNTSERSSLLGSPDASQYKPTTSLRLRSLLMYQPPSTLITSRPLPENATSLLIACLLGLNAFYAAYNVSWTLPLMFVWSDRTALCFAANLPWLYLLSAKNQPLRLLTGYSYEHLNILHRRLGAWICFLALLHTGSMLAVWYYFFLPSGRSLAWFLTEKTVLLGLITLACYQILYLTSLASFRRWWYERFLGMHIVLQAAALVFLYLHHRGSRLYVGVTLTIFLMDRLVFRLLLKSRSVDAEVRVMDDGSTVMLSADWPLSKTSKVSDLLHPDINGGWEPAQHVFVTAPALGRGHILQAHPFTIASAAPSRRSGSQHAWLNLIIRAQDGFTQDLLRHAQLISSLKVRLDGPYGSSHALDMLRSSDVCLLVAGGSGIAVAYPMLWALLHEDDDTPISRRQVGLIWITHESSHLDWIGHELLDEMKQLGLHILLPPPTAKAGRPDVARLVTELLDELSRGSGCSAKTGVVVSGPDSMNRAARNECSRLAWDGRDVNVLVEKFGW